MTTCGECGTAFDVDEARAEYEGEFNGELEYEDVDGELCGGCAIVQSESYMNTGRAIQMVNGDEDYDDEFVTKHL